MAMILTRLGDVSTVQYQCPGTTTLVSSPSQCPGYVPPAPAPNATMQDVAQLQAEIEALYTYTQAGMTPEGTTAGMPTGSAPAPATAPVNWGIVAAAIGAVALLMMSRR